MALINEIKLEKVELTNLSQINILMGKNGSGKSNLLRLIDSSFNYPSSYITPERGGSLMFQSGVEEQTIGNPRHLTDTRRNNQHANFKQQSFALFRKLAILTSMQTEDKIENDEQPKKAELFKSKVASINRLLDNIQIVRTASGFEIIQKNSSASIDPTKISSGESELISLAIEALYFVSDRGSNGGDGLLLLDEPDVHLHPDLQHQFCLFLKRLIANKNITVLIATHSTAIVGAFESTSECAVAFIKAEQQSIEFKKISETIRKIVPIFGAHPLSSIFLKTPILLVEGEDDVRIWQQAVRSSGGKLKLFPCDVGGVSKMHEFEIEVREIIESVYDKPIAYSIRDRDGGMYGIEDLGPVKRARLRCRTAENLLLSDDVLESIELDWRRLKGRIDCWLNTHSEHKYFPEMKEFSDNGFDRLTGDLKKVRNILLELMEVYRPWEVLVGRAIANPRGWQLKRVVGMAYSKAFFGN